MSPSTSPEPEPGKLNKVHTQRARWATRKMTVKSGRSKRMSILNRRQHQRGNSNEKNNASGEPPLGDEDPDDDDEANRGDGEGADDNDELINDNRTVYFNEPLPAELLDEEGHPVLEYARNKIRTAKYTPLSFVPKNIWFQFHNIANVFFLLVIILVVSLAWCPLWLH